MDDLAQSDAEGRDNRNHKDGRAHDELIGRYRRAIDPRQDRCQHNHGPAAEFGEKPPVHRLRVLSFFVHHSPSQLLCLLKLERGGGLDIDATLLSVSPQFFGVRGFPHLEPERAAVDRDGLRAWDFGDNIPDNLAIVG